MDSVVRLGSLGSVHVQEYEVARVCGVGESRRIVAELHGRVSAFVRVLLPIVGVLVLLLGVTGFGRILWFILINGCGLIWFLLLPFCSVIVLLLLGVLVFLLILLGLMKNSERPGFPIFVALDKGRPALDEFNLECSGWLPCLDEFFLPALTGDMLFEVVKRKSSTAGSLDGWGWRELKVLPVAWFDGLARILTRVEETGVWLMVYLTLTLL